MSVDAVLSGAQTWHVECGDALEMLRAMPEHSVDACVTDPPYGIAFMGQAWDSFSPAVLERATADHRPIDHRLQTGRSGSMHAGQYDQSATDHERFQEWCRAWGAEVLRVLKPGGHLLSFGGTRTYHRLVCGIEDAGLEIRDQLAWLFGSGFPKNHDLGDGLGTALKPAHEPMVLARAPLSEGTIAANVARWGTGGLDIDGTRIETGDHYAYPTGLGGNTFSVNGEPDGSRMAPTESHPAGRWPANVLLDEEAAFMLDEQSGVLVSGPESDRGHRRNADREAQRNTYGGFQGQDATGVLYGDRGGASRFFYVAKPDRAERNVGLDGGVASNWSDGRARLVDSDNPQGARDRRNFHPTVKPVALMQWLVRLVTPKGGVVLDPFTGSGTTGMAALREGCRFIGIEREKAYVEIAKARIIGDAPLFNQLPEVTK